MEDSSLLGDTDNNDKNDDDDTSICYPVGETAPLYLPRVRTPWDPWRCKVATTLILISTILERIAFYGVAFNLYLYLTMGKTSYTSWSPESAMTAVLVLNGLVYGSSPLTGLVADACLGRFCTIMVGYALYIVSLLIFMLLTHNLMSFSGCDFNLPTYLGQPCEIQVYVAIILLGFGAGAIRTNIPPFGAQQVQDNPTTVTTFFNLYYWCVNIGALIGIMLVSAFDLNIRDLSSVLNRGFFVGYIVTLTSIVMSALVFGFGRTWYVIHMRRKSAMTVVCRVIGRKCGTSCCGTNDIQRMNVVNPPDNASWVDSSLASEETRIHVTENRDVKKMGKVFLVLLFLVPGFWLTYFQTDSGFQAQGLHLNISFPQVQFEVPAAWMTVFDDLFLIICIPILTGVVYPCLQKCGSPISLLTRIACGMFFSLLAILSASCLEWYNHKAWNDGDRHVQNVSGSEYDCTSISVFTQVPQYCLLGMGEALATIAALEYAFVESPVPLQGLVMGLHNFLAGLGSFMGIGLLAVVPSHWIPSNRTNYFQGHMDYYFFVLSGFQGVFVIAFVIALCVRARHARWVAEHAGPINDQIYHQNNQQT